MKISSFFFNTLLESQKTFQTLYNKAKKVQNYFLIAIPYLWLSFFFLIPFILILKISFSEAIVNIPPFTSIFEFFNNNLLQIRLNLNNYFFLLSDSFYIKAFLSSLSISLLSTFICLLIGYSMAYSISQVNQKLRIILLLLIILPFCTSFLIRVYAWMNMLSTQGIINSVLMRCGIINTPLYLLDNSYAVCLGITYCYLPFMVLPIYAALEKIDLVYIEAAYDLGSGPWRTFWHVTIPLSLSGIISGCILVFIPAIGEFVIPELLGGPDTLMIGRALWWEFFNNRDWPLACALAVLMVILFVVPIMVFHRKQQTDIEEG